MKNIKYLAPAAIIASLVIGSPAYAIADFSASGSNVYVGDTFTVTLSIDAAAAWNIHISSDGPVENCSLVDANTTPDALDAEQEFTAECQATETGEITVSLSGDYTTADGTTIDLSDELVVTADIKPEEEPGPGEEPGEEPTDEDPAEGTAGNIPDTGANHGKSSAGADESTYLIAFPIAAMLALLGWAIHRKVRRA
ncbi:hypothetical protein IKG31_01390 [Candidatus Saccharibacteria bacterium]|nr:hypothetical protein [Candidatus Saccharibacteria bacterium]